MSSELGVERPTTLPLPEPQEARRVHFGEVNSIFIRDGRTETSANLTRDPDFRPKRSRSASFSAGEFRYGNKRRKKYRVLPSKFLLGGNITDPLNLGSLDKEEASQLGLVEGSGGATAKKSDAVRVLIPPNINDPLNLDVSSENEDSLNDALQRQLRRKRRSRKRKRRLSEPSGELRESIGCEPLRSESLEECQTAYSESEVFTPISEVFPKFSVDKLQPLSVDTDLAVPTIVREDQQKEPLGQQPPTTPTNKPSTSGFQRPAFKKQRSKSDNKIVSPVIPQPGVDRKRHPSHSRHNAEQPHLSQQNLKLPKKFNPKNELFQYGNYNKYYGYRNPDMTPDMRLNYLRREWFEGKDVLDVGCNIGHITLTIARDFNPKSVVGVDIDKKLVNIAQKNIKHYMQKGNMEENNFPKSMKLLYGPLKPQIPVEGGRRFPYNVKFTHANYVLESNELLETVRPEFDVIMCLSITKWVHLNWGDSGLKRFFRRIFYNLRPGGRLVLEPQGWPSYNKRKKLTMRIFENYKNIRLFPDKFNDYLLHEVGFSTSEKIITPQHSSRGFQRPIIVYTKAGVTSKLKVVPLARKPQDASTKRDHHQQGNEKNAVYSKETNLLTISCENNGSKGSLLTTKCENITKETSSVTMCENDGMQESVSVLECQKVSSQENLMDIDCENNSTKDSQLDAGCENYSTIEKASLSRSVNVGIEETLMVVKSENNSSKANFLASSCNSGGMKKASETNCETFGSKENSMVNECVYNSTKDSLIDTGRENDSANKNASVTKCKEDAKLNSMVINCKNDDTKAISSAAKGQNEVSNSQNDSCKNGDFDLTNKNAQGHRSPNSKACGVRVVPLDCVANNLCNSNKSTSRDMRGLDSNKGSGDIVCDKFSKRSPSTSSDDNSYNSLTHSTSDTLVQCVVNLSSSSSPSTDVADLSSSKICTKTEATSKAELQTFENNSKSDNVERKDSNKFERDRQTFSSSDTSRTSLGSENSRSSSSSTHETILKPCETRDTVCEMLEKKPRETRPEVCELSGKRDLGEDSKNATLLPTKEIISPDK
ncbi:hypothetical protein SK128_002908 [Halocaridina rubra]|uniref:RNA methyltransferase n=1 Tax=Halocaridina rubra TaxID=373956 RepID=A0AAN8WS85_HALRR